jgi:hypothetical protein
LLGFHDFVISNSLDTKYLCLEVDAINRPPLAGELHGVGYVENGEFVRVGTTTAMNYPQGARQQWVPGTDFFTVNNLVGDHWGTDLYDATSKQLVDRFDSTTHMLSKDGKLAYGLDYARLYRLGVYGYPGVADKYNNEPLPDKSGITVMDMQTKESKLLVSVKQVAECDTKNDTLYGHHYLTHLCVSPDSSRIAFLHRYPLADGGEMTRLMTIGANGSNLRCVASGFLSHFDWKDDETIYIYGRAGSAVEGLRNSPIMNRPFVRFSAELAKRVIRVFIGKDKSIVGRSNSFLLVKDSPIKSIVPFAKDIIPYDGHPMTCPQNNNYCSLDTYPDENGIRDLMLYDFAKDLRIDLGTYKMSDEQPDMTLVDTFFSGVEPKIVKAVTPEWLSFTRSGLHCDLHPRWNSKGDKIFFDSIHEGTRQLYYIEVEKIINS